MKKILIIGCDGYLGSQLIEYLTDSGYACSGIDIGFFRYGVLRHPKSDLDVRSGDIRNIDESHIKGFDVVIQLAALSNDPVTGLAPNHMYDLTRLYTKKIAQICKKLGVRFIFPSSCSVYGQADEIVNEASNVNPLTLYSKNKIEIEQDLADMSGGDFSPIALRFSTVYGFSPRLRFDLVINMLCGMAITSNKLLLNSNGAAWRPHIHIDDVCQAFARCVDWNYSAPELMTLNVGRNDNNKTIIDLAKYLCEKLPSCELNFLEGGEIKTSDELVKDRKIHAGIDMRTYKVDFSKIEKTLPNFKIIYSVYEGIDDLLIKLSEVDLDIVKFKQKDLYRLQYLEHLVLTKQLDSDLNFKR